MGDIRLCITEQRWTRRVLGCLGLCSWSRHRSSKSGRFQRLWMSRIHQNTSARSSKIMLTVSLTSSLNDQCCYTMLIFNAVFWSLISQLCMCRYCCNNIVLILLWCSVVWIQDLYYQKSFFSFWIWIWICCHQLLQKWIGAQLLSSFSSWYSNFRTLLK